MKFKKILIIVVVFTVACFVLGCIIAVINFNKNKEKEQICNCSIDSFQYKITEIESEVENELSYNLSFEIEYSISATSTHRDLDIHVMCLKNKSKMRFTIDYCNTETAGFFNVGEVNYLNGYLDYSIPEDVPSIKVTAQLKITSTELIDDINNFLRIQPFNSCGDSKIKDEKNLLNEDRSFKMEYSTTSAIYYTFDDFSESYKVTSVHTSADFVNIPSMYQNYPVKFIEKDAFNSVKNIKRLVLPDTLTELPKGILSGLYSLEYLSFPLVDNYTADTEDTRFKDLFNNSVPHALKEININSGKVIGEYAFKECTSLESVILTDGIETIESSAFYNCSSLTSIVIPDSVTSIGSSAFYNCSSLTNITVPNSVTRVQFNAFNGCTNLKYNEYNNGYYLGSIEYPYTIFIKVKNYNDSNCEIHKDTKIIYSNAFKNYSYLKSILIRKDIAYIGPSAFEECSALTEVYYEGTIEQWCSLDCPIFNHSFSTTEPKHFYLRNSNNNWEEVTSLEIPSTITNIEFQQFCGFNSLTSVIIPESVVSIDNYAFRSCSNLTSITIPNSVTKIGNYVFQYCHNLTSVKISNSLESIGEGCFSNCLDIQYNEYNNGCYLGNDENPYYLFVKASNANINSCQIHAQTKLIGASAFYYCDKLTSITIPNSVTEIGNYAFSICKNLTSVTIENGVTTIGKGVFNQCNSLESIIIPDSVTSIGVEVFKNCLNLKEVYYTGTSTKWNRITIGESNSELTSATIYYYSETKPTEDGNYWHYVDGVVTKW